MDGRTSRDITIRPALTPADREAIFALRYRILSAAPRDDEDTDQPDPRIEDDLDANGALFGAWAHGELVGTVRTNSLDDAVMPAYRIGFAINEALGPDKISITTRLMVLPAYGHTGLLLDLARTIYQRALALGIDVDYLACEPSRAPVFHRLGYRPHAEFVHPADGAQSVMRLAVWDAAHLHNVWSPFAPILDDALTSRARGLALA